MSKDAVTKEPSQHCQRARSKHLIDERLLPFERLRRAATGQRVLACLRIRNLRIEFRNGSQPGRSCAGSRRSTAGREHTDRCWHCCRGQASRSCCHPLG